MQMWEVEEGGLYWATRRNTVQMPYAYPVLVRVLEYPSQTAGRPYNWARCAVLTAITREECYADKMQISDLYEYTDAGREAARRAWEERYGSRQCAECPHEHRIGIILRCYQCEHCSPESMIGGVCELTGLVSGGADNICERFKPRFYGAERDFESWDSWLDLMRKCVRNPNCQHHLRSVWKARSFEDWMATPVDIPVSAVDDQGIRVDRVRVDRRIFQQLAFRSGDDVICVSAHYPPRLSKHGLLLKGETWYDWRPVQRVRIRKDELPGE